MMYDENSQKNNINLSNSTGMENPSSKSIYEKANERIEKITEFIFFVSVKVSPIFIMIPYFFTSYFFYFTLDLGKEAFRMPYPLWLVLYLICNDELKLKREFKECSFKIEISLWRHSAAVSCTFLMLI